MSSCPICCETVELLGVECPTCHKQCCIPCETQFDRCPFCRSSLLNWFKRLLKAPESIETYYTEYYKRERKAQIRFQLAYLLSRQFLLGSPEAREKLEYGDLDDEDILNLLQIFRVYLYNSTVRKGCVREIEWFINILEHLWGRLENHNSAERYNVDLDFIEDTIFEANVEVESQATKWYQRLIHKNKKPKPFFSRYTRKILSKR